MAAARLTANFAELNNMADKVVHFGFAATGGKYQVMPTTSGNTQKVADNYTRATIMAFRSENRGLANVYRSQIGGDRIGNAAGVGADYNASANNAANVTQMMSGLELALASGPIKFQSEYARTNRDATHANVDYSTEAGVASTSASVDAKAKTLYTEIMYNVTGESWADSYKGGAFSGIKPKSNFVYGTGGGAWQVGLRYSSYDASDTVIGTGGFNKSRSQNSSKASTVTLAANWILNPNARVMFNVSQTRFDTGVEALDTAQDASTTKYETVFSVRTQINF
jgi:phosphate-selective porin